MKERGKDSNEAAPGVRQLPFAVRKKTWIVEEEGMDWHDTPYGANGHESINPGSSNHPPGFGLLWEEQQARSSVRRASLSPSGAMPTPGGRLSQMMALNAARPPQATQDELRALLQRFSRQRTQLRDTFFYAHTAFVEAISRTIAGQLMGPPQTGEMYMGVQRLSRVAGQMPRYTALLQSVRHVYVYGVNDLHHPSERAGFSHPRFVTLVLDRTRPTDLEWFWFMVMNVPGLQTALVAQQVEDSLWPDSHQTSLYKCLWTFNATQVQQIVDILRQAARMLWW